MLFDELGPIAQSRVVFSAHPDVGEHQLEYENQDCGGESNTGQNFDHSDVGFFFLFILDCECRRLGCAGK